MAPRDPGDPATVPTLEAASLWLGFPGSAARAAGPPRRADVGPASRVAAHAARRLPALQQVPDDEGGAVDVGLLGVDGVVRLGAVDDELIEHLGRHVAWRADLARVLALQGPQRGAGVEALGEAEVGELEGAAVAGDEDVGGLEVTVHHDGVEAVEIFESLEDVEGPGANLQRGLSRADS